MSKNKVPCFYTNMMDKLNLIDNKVNEIQKSITIFKAMINERIEFDDAHKQETDKKNDTE